MTAAVRDGARKPDTAPAEQPSAHESRDPASAAGALARQTVSDRRGIDGGPPRGARSGVRRIAAIDLVRALSVLWIVGCWHVFDYVPEWHGLRNPFTYRLTVACLALFVLISGFLLGQRRTPSSWADYRDFYVGRFGRVYPPFVLASLGFLMVGLETVGPLLKGVLLVGVLGSVLPHTLWFMVMLCALYALTPPLQTLRERPAAFAVVITGITLLLAWTSAHFADPDPRIAIYFPVYALGLWLAGRPARLTAYWRSFLGAAAIALCVSLIARPGATDQDLGMLPWALTIAPSILSLAMLADDALPRWPVIGAISAASFFVYLFHRIGYAVALHIVHPTQGAVRVALLSLICLPILILFSYYGQKLYDRLWSALTARIPPGHRPGDART